MVALKNKDESMRPGQSRNLAGLRKHKEFTDALRIDLATLDQGNHREMHKVAAALIREALKGNITSLKEVAYRIDCRLPQAQIIQGYDDGGPIRLYAELPMKSANSEAWLRESAPQKLIDAVARDEAE